MSYISGMGTNRGFNTGHGADSYTNPAAFMREPDHVNIPLFQLGHLGEEKGGLSMTTVLEVLRSVSFDAITVKVAYAFFDERGSVVIQFETTSDSNLASIYNQLCSLMGNPSSGTPTAAYNYCARSTADDVADNGCVMDGVASGTAYSERGSGNFCLQAVSFGRRGGSVNRGVVLVGGSADPEPAESNHSHHSHYLPLSFSFSLPLPLLQGPRLQAHLAQQ